MLELATEVRLLAIIRLGGHLTCFLTTPRFEFSGRPSWHDLGENCRASHPGVKSHGGHFRGIPLLRNTTHKNGAPVVRDSACIYCLILGFTAEYSKSVRKFTATYVNPIARMHPCTR